MEKITKLFVGGLALSMLVKLFYISITLIAVFLIYRIYRQVRYGFKYRDPGAKWWINNGHFKTTDSWFDSFCSFS